MKSPIKLLEPTPRVCPGQSPPYFSPAGNDFIRDVVSSVKSPLSACTVDGYIVSSSGKVTRIFFKREFEVTMKGANAKEIADALTVDPAVSAAKPSLKRIAKLLDCGVDYLFSPEGYPYSTNLPERMLLISVDDINSGRAKRRYINADLLAEHIRSYRGRSFTNPKPLTVSTSHIECFLVNNNVKKNSADPFPGDLDFILLEGDKVCSIVEFKTHNLKTAIDEESYSRYQDQDRRRLDVLLKLSTALKCKIFYIFWGPKHPQIKIEEISVDREIIQSKIMEKKANYLADFLSINK